MVTFLSKNLENVRSDTLPENTGYRDDGCDLSSSCLKCHLPLCKYDDSKFMVREIKIIRDKEIYNLSNNGASVDDLSKKFNLSKRTIQRAIKFSKDYKTRGKKTEESVLPLNMLPNITFYNEDIKNKIITLKEEAC